MQTTMAPAPSLASNEIQEPKPASVISQAPPEEEVKQEVVVQTNSFSVPKPNSLFHTADSERIEHNKQG